MRDCPNVEMRERLPELMHGVLRAEVAAEVRAHVAQCADCRAELELLERVRSMLVTPTSVDTSRIVAQLPRYRRPALWTRAARSPQLRAAAAVLLMVGGYAVLHNANPSDPAPDSAVAVAPSAPTQELSIGDTFQDLSDSDLQAMLDEIAKLEAVTPATTDEVVPAVVEPAARRASGGAEG